MVMYHLFYGEEWNTITRQDNPGICCISSKLNFWLFDTLASSTMNIRNDINACQKFSNTIKYFDFEWLETIVADDDWIPLKKCFEYQRLLSICKNSKQVIMIDEFRKLIKMRAFL